MTTYFHIDLATSSFFVPIELDSFDMTVNSSPQIESAKHQQEPKSSLYLQVIELSQNISFVHFGNIMPMGGEKLWSYVSEVLKIVKQN